MKVFSAIPFLRIILPFVVGIVVGIQYDIPGNKALYLLLLIIPLIFFNFSKTFQSSHKRLFMITADVFLLLFGQQLTENKKLNNSEYFYGNQINTDSLIDYIAVIQDVPLKKSNYTKCELNVIAVKKDSAFVKSEGKLIAYVKPENLNPLKAGQSLLLRTRLSSVTERKNPEEFNYKNYLNAKQIYHTAFIDSSSFVSFSDKAALNPIWSIGLQCKSFVLSGLKKSGLSDTAYSICAALLTGYDDEIDKSVMQAFSHSGTLHVLSVSGLHTGLIYLCLNFLFDLLDKKRRYKLLRFACITLILWFFALITGFSAPVLRAVIMFNLLGIGQIYFTAQLRNQINILLVSAFVLLCYNPFYLVDVGFQLSYMALFGLLYFQPKFDRLWQPTNVLLNFSWKSITTSLAATISTLPLTLFYFKQFPLWFFICNMVVVPATFLLLLLALFALFKVEMIVIFINFLIKHLVLFIQLFNSENRGYIDAIHFTVNDLYLLTLIIILVSVVIEQRQYKALVLSLLVLILWQILALFQSYELKQTSGLAVYHIKKGQAVSVKNKKQLSLFISDTMSFDFHVKPHLTSLNNPELEYKRFNFVKSENTQFLFLDKPYFWPKTEYSEIKTLVISNNFKLSAQDLLAFKSLKTLVADASNNRQTLTNARELSRKFGFSFYNIKYEGAYLSELP